MERMITLSVVGILLVVPAAAEQRNDPSVESARGYLKRKLSAAERQGNLEEVLLDQLRFVSEVWLDEPEEYYDKLMEKLGTCATPKAIPVLERLLDRMGEFPETEMLRLQEHAAQLWYELRTSGLSRAEKARVALDFFAEHALQPLEALADDWLVAVGEPARPALYSFLEQKSRDDLPVPSVFFSEETFKPTDEEIARFLSLAGTLGCEAMVRYLLERGDARADGAINRILAAPNDPSHKWVVAMIAKRGDKRALRPLIEFSQSDDYELKILGVKNLEHMKAYREAIIPILIQEASKERLVRTTPDNEQDWNTSARHDIFHILYKMGKNPQTIAFYREYLEQMTPEWFFDDDLLVAHARFVRTAALALKDWGIEPCLRRRNSSKNLEQHSP